MYSSWKNPGAPTSQAFRGGLDFSWLQEALSAEDSTVSAATSSSTSGSATAASATPASVSAPGVVADSNGGELQPSTTFAAPSGQGAAAQANLSRGKIRKS